MLAGDEIHRFFETARDKHRIPIGGMIGQNNIRACHIRCRLTGIIEYYLGNQIRRGSQKFIEK
jgi:hypothetical protein